MTKGPYPSDVTDAQWRLIQPLIPPSSHGGRPRTLDMRQVVNALLYLQRTRCGWRHLPSDLPSPSSVRHYHDRWRADGTWERIITALGAPERGHGAREGDT